MTRSSHKPAGLLPKLWPARARSAVLHAISLATTAVTVVRGRALDSRHLLDRRSAEVETLREEVALLREELALKDARMARLAAHRRPHYKPLDRMAILELRCRRGWTVVRTAERFHLEPKTLAAWLRRLDEPGDRSLVQTVTPVNRYPDFVAYLVQRLRTLCPTMGRRRVADVLARAGLHLGSSTVRRMSGRAVIEHGPAPGAALRRQLVAKAPHDVWGLDLTVVPAHGGLWTLLRPWAWLQRWPFCLWVAAVVDWHTRRAVGFAVYRQQPTGRDMTTLLRRAMASACARPRTVVTDRGVQFDGRTFRRWCERHGIRQRFGAVGRPGSIALVERFIRSLKDECTRLEVSFLEGRRHLPVVQLCHAA